MESLTPELQNLVLQVASKNNITNFVVEINNSISKEGDGYIGIVNGLSVIDKDSDKKLNMVVKKAPANENLRKQFPTRLVFLREILMYEKVFPELVKFQEDYNIPNPFKSITNFYGSIDDELKETLLLENLKEDGYKLCRRQDPLDSHHLRIVLVQYAKLHALSHAMRKLEPERFEKLKKSIGGHPMMNYRPGQMDQNDSDAPQMPTDAMAAMAEQLFIPTMETVKNKPKMLEAVNKFKNSNLNTMFIEAETQLLGEHNVISHGDCWSTNLLFKYEDQNTPNIPTKLMIIDWQMSMVHSPVYDLSYFLYISAKKEDLENYMEYLQIYHDALSDTLTAFGLDPEAVYPFELFLKQWKEKSKMGFFATLLMMQQTLSEGKTHDFEELAKDGKLIFEAFGDRKNQITDLFKQRMGDLVEFLVEQNFI